jgi:P-loop Domain of unknown function (DUF2791)
MTPLIKPKDRAAILSSLRAGVVPRIGLQHFQVGRLDEVNAVLTDLDQIGQGGAAVRFVIGRFGAGKSFFLNLCRMAALKKRFVVAQADLTLDRRLHGNGGQARNLYTALLQNLAILAKPDGGALPSIVERWVSDLQHEVKSAGGTDADVVLAIHDRLKPLQDLVSGHDFATVVGKYLEGFLTHNDLLTSNALRWLRGEYGTKTEARQDLGVRAIIDDADIYDYLKLLAAFVRMAGYTGLLVCVDEMGVLSHRLSHPGARSANFEAILRIVNDCLQGGAVGIGFYFAGINEFLEDQRRGLFSYDALRTRLEDKKLLLGTLRDLSGPVIQLANLTPEELFVLLDKIVNVFAGGDSTRLLVPHEAIKAFMEHCSRGLGASYFQTPRDVLRPFVSLLSILEQNPGTDWRTLVENAQFEKSPDPDKDSTITEAVSPGSADEIKTFRL